MVGWYLPGFLISTAYGVAGSDCWNLDMEKAKVGGRNALLDPHEICRGSVSENAAMYVL